MTHSVNDDRGMWDEGPAAAGPDAMPAQPGRPEMAAALLHDVGKVDAQLRTPARVVATLDGLHGLDRVGSAAPRQPGLRPRRPRSPSRGP